MHILACGRRNKFPKCEHSLVIPVNLYKYGLLWFGCQQCKWILIAGNYYN